MPHCAAYGQATPPPATRNHIQLNKPGRLLPVEPPFNSPALVQTCAACSRRRRRFYSLREGKRMRTGGRLRCILRPTRLLMPVNSKLCLYGGAFVYILWPLAGGRLLGNQPPVA